MGIVMKNVLPFSLILATHIFPPTDASEHANLRNDTPFP